MGDLEAQFYFLHNSSMGLARSFGYFECDTNPGDRSSPAVHPLLGVWPRLARQLSSPAFVF